MINNNENRWNFAFDEEKMILIFSNAYPNNDFASSSMLPPNDTKNLVCPPSRQRTPSYMCEDRPRETVCVCVNSHTRERGNRAARTAGVCVSGMWFPHDTRYRLPARFMSVRYHYCPSRSNLFSYVREF